MTAKPSKPPRYVVLHEVHCNRATTEGHNHASHPSEATYFDVPRLFARDSCASHLRGKEQVFDLNTYQHQNDDVCVIVYRRYDCQDYHDTYHQQSTKYSVPTWVKSMGPYDARPWFYFLTEDAPEATAESEYILLCSDVLKRVLQTLRPSVGPADSDSPLDDKLESPYDHFYHHHATLRQLSESPSFQDQQLMLVLLDYIAESQRHNFEEADVVFGEGYILRARFGKLFKVSDIVLKSEPWGLRAYRIESIDDYTRDSVNIECWAWEFDL